jgi:hypothetical protein
VPQGQNDGADHGHEKHQSRRLKNIDVVGIQDPTDHFSVRNIRQRGLGQGVGLDRAATGDRRSHHHHFQRQDPGNQATDGQILGKSLPQGNEVHIQHHHDEQEQDGDGPDIDNDQQHGEELRAHENEQSSGRKKCGNQEQHRVNRVFG